MGEFIPGDEAFKQVMANIYSRLVDNAPTQTVGIEVSEGGKVPTKGHGTDVGMDFYTSEDVLVFPGMYKSKLVPTGVRVELPTDMGLFLSPRSSMSKLPVTLANQTGIIDPDYRGEIMFPLKNTLPMSLHKEGPREWVNCSLEVLSVDSSGKGLERVPAYQLPKKLVRDGWDEFSEQYNFLKPNSRVSKDEEEIRTLPVNTLYIPKGTRLVQGYLVPRYNIEWVEKQVESDTVRGSGGFGSTGVN